MVWRATCGRALSWRHTPLVSIPLQFWMARLSFLSITIPLSVYCGPMTLAADCSFEFSRLGRRGMLPLTWLLFGLRCEVERPGFVTCDNRIQNVVIFVCVALKKLAWGVNALSLVVFCVHTWDPAVRSGVLYAKSHKNVTRYFWFKFVLSEYNYIHFTASPMYWIWTARVSVDNHFNDISTQRATVSYRCTMPCLWRCSTAKVNSAA